MPLYLQLKQLLRAQIEHGELAAGTRLPSESSLQKTYGISRATVRQAVGELIDDGLLYRRPGLGTIVSLPKIRPELVKLTSFTEDMLARGLRPASTTLSIEQLPAPGDAREALQLAAQAPVWKVVRLRSANEEPIGLHELYLPADLGLGRAELEGLTSFYELVSRRLGLHPERGFESLTAAKAGPAVARLLRVEVDSPLLTIRRTTFAHTGTAFEYVKMTYRADRYEYHAVLHR